MKTINLVILISALTLLFSCNSKNEEKGKEKLFLENEYTLSDNACFYELPDKVNKEDFIPSTFAWDQKSGESNNSNKGTDNKPIIYNKKIIKDGNISVRTNDISASKKGIDELLKKFNAYYDKEDLKNDSMKISYDLKVRVPADKFEKLISGIESSNNEIKNKMIQASDVTEEYVDIETRLINKRDYLKRYKELLTKASSVKDILEIEENIRKLQEEIESKEGRLKYLSDQVQFSTLYINLYKDKEYVYKAETQDKFSERVKNSLSNGWISFVNFVLLTITFWPSLILIFVGFFAIRFYFKRRRKREL